MSRSGKAWIIYGATGYTGRLVAEPAKREGLTPIVAARGGAALKALAQELGFEERTFALDDPAAMREALKDVAVLAHCAGPFSATSAPMRAVRPRMRRTRSRGRRASSCARASGST